MASDTNQHITEIQNAADALCSWFESQGINDGRAVAVMSYLMGAMAVINVDNFEQAYSKLKIAHAASMSIAMSAIELRR